MKPLLQIDIKSKSEMKKLGKSLSKFLKIEDVVCFNGTLGVGKTFLCRVLLLIILPKLKKSRAQALI